MIHPKICRTVVVAIICASGDLNSSDGGDFTCITLFSTVIDSKDLMEKSRRQ
jgi:hypothetical protein